MSGLQGSTDAPPKKRQTRFRQVVFPKTQKIRQSKKKPQFTKEQPFEREPDSALGLEKIEDVGTLSEAISSFIPSGKRQPELTSLPSSPSPLSILRKGGSDPFSSFAIPISPAVNSLMTLYRDCVIPSMYSLPTHSVWSSAAATRDWQECVDSLQDACSAYAFLARHATIGSFVSSDPNLSRQALLYRNRSTVLLRSRLARNTATYSPEMQQLHSQQTYWQINLLFDAETVGKNYTAAKVHGQMLKLLLEKHFEMHGSVDLTLLNYILWSDTSLAAMFLARPTFEYDTWVPGAFQKSWEAARGVLPEFLPDDATSLDPSIETESMRTVFIWRQQGMQVWASQKGSTASDETKKDKGKDKVKNKDKVKDKNEIKDKDKVKDKDKDSARLLIFSWLASRQYCCQGRLVNLYLSATEAISKIPQGDSSNAFLYAQLYLSLGALCYTRAVATPPDAMGVTLYNAGPKILGELRRVLEDCLEGNSGASTKPHQQKYRRAILWALYVGASAEQAQMLLRGKSERARSVESETSSSTEDAEWFTTHFALHAMSMGLLSWHGVRKILAGFLYTDHMQPHASDWFWKAMSTCLERHGRE